MAKVTEAALAAAREWDARAGAGLSTPVLHGIIEAALPHLEVDQRDGLDGEYWTERFDVLTNAVDKLTDLVVDHRAEWERLAEAGAPVSGQSVRVDAALSYLRGQKMGMEVARAHGEGGPTDYEVWRDALLISATAQSGPEASPGIVEEEARTYLRILRLLGGVRPEDEAVEDPTDCTVVF